MQQLDLYIVSDNVLSKYGYRAHRMPPRREARFGALMLEAAIKENHHNAKAWSNGKALTLPPIAKPVIKEPPTRMKVLDALYKGTRNRPAITVETGLSSNSAASALRVLVELGLVYKITPKRGNLYSYRITEAGRKVVNTAE